MIAFIKKYKIYAIVCSLVAVIGIALILFVFRAVSPLPPSPDYMASRHVSRIYTAAREFFQNNPNAVFDYNALTKYVSLSSSKIGIAIIDGSEENLTVLTMHKKGSAVYVVRKDGLPHRFKWQ